MPRVTTSNDDDDNGLVDCDCCGDTTDESDITRYEGERLCPNCFENRTNEDDESDERNEYINDHDYKPTALFHNDNGKASRSQAILNSFPRMYVGIEVETESTNGANLGNNAEYVVDNTDGLIYIKQDGSINHGFEMVSHPMTLSYAQNHLDGLWRSFAHLRKNGFRAWQTSTCGLHIHISRNAFLNDKHQQKFLYFVYGPASETIKKFAGRDSHWSKFDKDSFVGNIWSRDENGNDQYVVPSLMEVVKGITKSGISVSSQANERYLAVNRNNRHTLELRFFRPSLRPDTVLACIEFTYCLWAYTEQVTSNQALKHGALTDFEQFAIYARANRATYPKLVAHLAYRKVSADPDEPQPVLLGEE